MIPDKKLPISLCMIVRNEEKYLEACLLSVLPFVSEIIVVDTGSTDRTIEIATHFGARMYHFEWVNDFAAARNFALAQATQPWILQLDADEELLPLSADWLQKSDLRETADVWQVEIRNLRYENQPDVMSTHFLTRFYRNHPEIRYHFKIHENILLPPNGVSGISPLVIVHKGYADVARKAEKSDRNFRLLKETLAENPANPYTHYYLAQQYYAIGDGQNAARAAKKALQLGAKGAVLPMIHRFILSWAVNFGTIEQAKEALQAAPKTSIFPELLFYKGLFAIKQGDFETGAQTFSAFLACAKQFIPPSGFEPVLPDNLRNGYRLKAECEEKTGLIDDALNTLTSALQEYSDGWQLRAKRASLFFQTGRRGEALEEFHKTLQLVEELPPSETRNSAIKNFTSIINRISLLPEAHQS